MAQDLIEQIVAGVLAELNRNPGPVAPLAPPAVVAPVPTAKAPALTVAVPSVGLAPLTLFEPVITAQVLMERAAAVKAVRFQPKAVITPAARDWLKAKGIAWEKVGVAGGAQQVTATTAAANWRVLVSTATDVVATLRKTMTQATWELSGGADEAAARAASLIATAEAVGVVVLSQRPERGVVRANRVRGVRAVAMAHARDWDVVCKSLGPNVVIVNPQGRSTFELRPLLEKICAAGVPVAPADWFEAD